MACNSKEGITLFTTFKYLYRDSNGNKRFESVCLEGAMALEEIQPYLLDAVSFIPAEVDIPDLRDQFDTLTNPYRDWHEVDRLIVTLDPSGPPLCTAEEFVSRFHTANENRWNAARASLQGDTTYVREI
jgi:hypothetical protein